MSPHPRADVEDLKLQGSPNLQRFLKREKEESEALAAQRPPVMPGYLSDAAKPIWNETLRQQPNLAAADSTVLAAFCETVARWLAVKDSFIPDDVKDARDCVREIRQYARDLGLSPAGRQRLRSVLKPKPKTTETPDAGFEKFMRPAKFEAEPN